MCNLAQDNFKWFGEGFSGFPKRLPEDCIEYIIHIINPTLSPNQTRAHLLSLQKASSLLQKKLLKDYIWQRDPFALSLVHEEGQWLLRGCTNYGDSIADEWLIVYLLRELSMQFSDAWIRVYDTDGEFLLIEAANALPKWLNPEVAENRVWIHDAKLLVLPLSNPSKPQPLTLKESLAAISGSPSTFQHLRAVEAEAFRRLMPYPGAITQNQHYATVPIPRKLAAILHASPRYVAPAVESFYLRDPIALRSLQPKDAKRLRFPPEDFVNVSVCFTRILFAQLRSQEWAPPGIWSEALASLSEAAGNGGAVEKVEIGIKLAAGFEMLIKDNKNADKQAVREIELLLEDIESGNEALPTDQEIAMWSAREDDEKWLDINFEDFEKELAGKGANSSDTPKSGEANEEQNRGFGDKAAQENLRKMVERFEAFLNDDDAGIEGAEGLDDMDFDNDDPEDDDAVDDSDEEEEIEFDEAEFARMMREMMGMPSEDDKVTLIDEARALARAEELGSDEEEELNDGDEIRKVMERIEAELNESGALDLDITPRKIVASKGAVKGKGKRRAVELVQEYEGESEDDGEVDIDFNLAKNLLESLKGQGGLAGPAGNLMGLMGVQFPPDEDDRVTVVNDRVER
ncbi:SGT1-domain-containing protein [Lepidopterella palustris CBS 459.81]|uniref:SGT1-domain-containing protein n=1 Tax=Lepidopterella palustris CBS 459.81 TaxID=1314670 RepID=A0A8E2JCR5_9PEZI|nr:SGT1-domain-containing protein [Lepidopterella palustris CBS 459.81]